MEMKEFAKIVKDSKIAGNNKEKIIYILLQALGAEPAISGPAKFAYDDKKTGQSTIQSPTSDTIKKWFSPGGGPQTIRYFPSFTVEDKEEKAHEFLRKLTGNDKWIELRNLFKKWHDENPSDEAFYIDTETNDFRTFSTSFWKQFISYFESLKMWDDRKHGIKYEMTNIFKEKFIQYKVYKFIPKDIENVIESLYIYRGILDENAKLVMQEGSISDYDTAHSAKKMYCKLYPSHDNFIFCAVVRCNGFWGLQMPEKCILLKFPESFEHDMIPTNTCRSESTENIEYAIVDHFPEDEQFNGEELPWEKCQGDIIFIDFDIPTKTRGFANESIPAEIIAAVNENAIADQDTSASEYIPDDEDYAIIEDCYVLIDGMLELDSSIDEFVAIIQEKIIEKYEGVTFDDNLRQLYNDIKQYRNSLKEFKNYLIKYRNLEKVKSEYLSDQAFIKQFGIYPAFSGFEPAPKPLYPFSELYLDPEEARKVESRLHHYHQSLIELYTEIIG